MAKTKKRTKKYRYSNGPRILLIGLAAVLALLIGANYYFDATIKSKPFYANSSTAPPALTPVYFGDTSQTSLGVVLEETAAVSDDYFTDAIFVGDSLTDGFRLFDFLSGFNSIGYVGINTQSAQYLSFYNTPDGQQLTMVEAITYYKPRKIYIMLGSNGINFETPEWLIENYETLAALIQSQNPDAYLILQSIPPATAEKAANDSHYTTENVDNYNNMIKQLALENGYYFLDTNSCLRGENGFMTQDYAAGDGIHMNRDGYYAWYQYIVTHTIQGEAAYSINKEGFLVAVGREFEEADSADEQPQTGSENGEGDPPIEENSQTEE